MANRLLLTAALLLAAFSARAEDADIRLERVTLYQLARLVYGEILQEPYAVDGFVIASEEVATLDVRRTSPDAARKLLDGLLRSRGFEVVKDGAVNVVRRVEPPKLPERLFTYRPKFRSVSYLQGAVRSFIRRGRFAGGSGPIPQGAIQPGTVPQAPPGQKPDSVQSAVTAVIPVAGVVLSNEDVFTFEGPFEDVDKLEALVAVFDVPAREVVVRAHVFEVGTSVADGSAVSLAVNLLGGKVRASNASVPLGSSISVSVSGIEAAYSVLSQDSRFKVVSSPTLRIRSGDHGRLQVGSEVPVLGAVSVNAQGQALQSVEYRSSGVILDLSPVVLQEVVSLQVEQQLSSFVATTTGVNSSPTLLKRQIRTALSLHAGEVVLLGGLDENRDSDARSGLPGFLSFLADKRKDVSRTELVLMLEAQPL